MLNKYECIFIVDATLADDQIQALAEKFKSLVESAATLEGFEDWGKKKLAYAINYKTEGQYFLVNFSSDADFPKELERNFKITDGVIKYMTVKRAV
ncbi:MAG: 30S ribosomal protein S6 [Clostridia bacterium]|nr:30S ribosomal protein S6 [Clostridia bacterium]